MILHHSAKPKPDPIPTPTPRTPSSAYARCLDCGTDAGEPCYDSHDRPCAPCPGRVLASTGAERRARQQRSSKAKAAPAARERYTATCTHCGVGGLRNHATYCQERECQLERLRVYRREHPPKQRIRKRAKRASRKAPPHPCAWCGVAVGARSKYCEATACQAERRRSYRAAKPPKRKSRSKPVPCWWCKLPLPLSGNAGGRFAGCDRPCCGDHACKRAIKRDFAERSRAAKPQEQEQQQHT